MLSKLLGVLILVSLSVDKVRFNGLVDVKERLDPSGQSFGGALFAIGASAYMEKGIHIVT